MLLLPSKRQEGEMQKEKFIESLAESDATFSDEENLFFAQARFNALSLAEFCPLKTEQYLNEITIDKLAEASASKKCYSWMPEK